MLRAMHLTSDSTTLRLLSPHDLKAFQAYRQDPEVARFQTWEQMDEARATGFLHHAAATEPLRDPGQWAQIAVAETQGDGLIGDMGLFLSADARTVELGVTIARAHQRKGHARRAIALAVAYVFAQTTADRILAWADTRNAASRALLERTGFTFLGLETNDGIDEAAFEMRRAAVD